MKLLKLIACLFGRHDWCYINRLGYRTCRWCSKAKQVLWMWHKCDDCGKENVRPFDNGDGKTRCDQCVVAKYLSRLTKDVRPEEWPPIGQREEDDKGQRHDA